MKKLEFFSIKEKPAYTQAILDSQREHWWACMPWTEKHMKACRKPGDLPDTYVAVADGKPVGTYTLLMKELLYSKEVGLWIGTLYIFPEARGWHLTPILLEHALRRGAELGHDKMYLASEHVNLYEKFGWLAAGPDLCALGEPTMMYVHDTIGPVKHAAAA